MGNNYAKHAQTVDATAEQDRRMEVGGCADRFRRVCNEEAFECVPGRQVIP